MPATRRSSVAPQAANTLSTSSAHPQHPPKPAPPPISDFVYETELLTQHFGYTPLALADDYVNHFNEPVGGIMDAIEDYFAKILEDQGEGDLETEGEIQDEIRSGIHCLQTLLEHLIDKNVDKLELFLFRNILTIPNGLRLLLPYQSDLDIEHSGTAEDEAALAAELNRKRAELLEVYKLNSHLRRQLTRYRSHLERVRTHTSSLAPLEPALATLPDTHATTSASLQAAYDRFLSLREAQPLSAALPPASEGEESWRHGRAGYLNWQAGRQVQEGGIRPVRETLESMGSVEQVEQVRDAL